MRLYWPFAALLFSTFLFFPAAIDKGYAQQVGTAEVQPPHQTRNLGAQPRSNWPKRDAADLQVVADLTAERVEYKGTCPTICTFTGRIYVNRPVTVMYKFLRSDGVQTEPASLVFQKAGQQEVTHRWELGNAKPTASEPEIKGAVVMQVVAPVNRKVQSNEAVVKVTCTEQGLLFHKNAIGSTTGPTPSEASPSRQVQTNPFPLPSESRAGGKVPASMAMTPPVGTKSNSSVPAINPKPPMESGPTPGPASGTAPSIGK